VLTARVVGAESVTTHLGLIPQKAHGRVKIAVNQLVMQLLRKVKADKLSGQVLRNQTGRLRRSINSQVIDTPDSITGSVGTNVVYGRRWEEGFRGTEQVKAHVRSIRQAWGRSITPREVQVGAFSRDLDIRPRPFLGPSLQELGPTIREVLGAALRESI